VPVPTDIHILYQQKCSTVIIMIIKCFSVLECQGVAAATLSCKKNNKKNDYQLVVANRSRRKEASGERMRLQLRLIL
jgi:hypothetical protein